MRAGIASSSGLAKRLLGKTSASKINSEMDVLWLGAFVTPDAVEKKIYIDEIFEPPEP